ncbi:MAG: glycosyltransferase family 4 protein [Anaerolineae bacterium]|nr:glycosyltransferase family 4 protein [Anaerolineae bacterium]
MAASFAGRRACFFARVASMAALLERQWYQIDIRILRELGFDVVIALSPRDIPLGCDLYFSWWPTWSIFPLAVARLCRKPIVIVVGGEEVLNSLRTLESYYSKPFPVRWAIRTCLRQADCVLVLSEHIRREAANLHRREIVVIPLGIDTVQYSPGNEAEKGGHILTISKLGENHFHRKRIGVILEAIPSVLEWYPEQRFVFAGEKADAFPRIEQMVARLDIEGNVHFTGRITDAQKLELLRGAVIYLQPTMHEGFGMAIAEAMSCGLPVITSAVGAVPEVVGDCAVFVDPDRPEQMAEAIIHLLADPERRGELGRAGRRRIEELFAYEKRKARLAEILEDLLASSHSAARQKRQ